MADSMAASVIHDDSLFVLTYYRSALGEFETVQAQWKRQYFELYQNYSPLMHQSCHVVSSIRAAGPLIGRNAARFLPLVLLYTHVQAHPH